MVKILLSLSAIFVCLKTTAAPVEVITLSPKEVAELILKQSYRAQEVNLQSQQTRLARATVEKGYDFSLSADSGYQYSKFEDAKNSYLLNDQTYTTNISLKKPFFTGTTLEATYARNIDKPTVSIAAPTGAADLVTDVIGISLTQNLWKNFFGIADRADLRAAESTYQSAMILRVNQLQDLVLEGIRNFWTTYVAQETFQAALNSRTRYLKLVEQIKKKTNYGYSNPGELAQAQAELEGREQNVKNSSVAYLASLDSLISLLRLKPGSEVKFNISEEVPTPPQATPVEIENLRPLKSSKLQLEASQDSLKSSNSKNYPDLSLVGKMYQQGFDKNASDSYSEMAAGTNPRYYVGLQLQYSFGSGFDGENVLNKRVTRDLAEAQLNRSRLELKDKQSNLLRKLQSTYAVAQSTRNQKGYREKAAQELTKSYTQGRTDISLLITALNNYFDSEVQFTRAVGDYQTALNEWAAFRDELIPDMKETR